MWNYVHFLIRQFIFAKIVWLTSDLGLVSSPGKFQRVRDPLNHKGPHSKLGRQSLVQSPIPHFRKLLNHEVYFKRSPQLMRHLSNICYFSFLYQNFHKGWNNWTEGNRISTKNWQFSTAKVPVRSSVHTNPSRKRSYSKTLFKPEEFKTPASHLSMDGKDFENGAFRDRWHFPSRVLPKHQCKMAGDWMRFQIPAA